MKEYWVAYEVSGHLPVKATSKALASAYVESELMEALDKSEISDYSVWVS